VYITRHMEKPVMELNEQYPVLLLTGPRQVGKTTMLEHLIEVEGKGRKKVSLDDLTLRELAKTDPKMFFQLYQPPLLIDEVQYAPELFPYIKIMVDERHQPGDFWLTGSQLFKMMEGVQESLAGRVALLHLSPLSQSEIMKRPPEPPFSLELPLLSEPQKLQAVNVIGQPPHIPFHVSVNVTGIEDGGIGISSCDQGRHPALMDTLKDLWRVQHLASVLPF
jgi:uncharacterized protein